MNKPKVSILIPTFNQNPAYLHAALVSAKHQTYPCEIIVVDDGSDPPQEDLVAEVLEGYSKKNKLKAKYVFQKNKGVAGALNRAIKESSGEYLQWLPSDDIYHVEKTRRQLDAMLVDQAMASYCSYEDGIPSASAHYAAAQYPSKKALFSALQQHCFINAATLMWHRSAMAVVGTFNEKLVHAQDYGFILSLAENYNFTAVNRLLMRRRIHPGQMINTLRTEEEQVKKIADMEFLSKRFGVTAGVYIPSEAK